MRRDNAHIALHRRMERRLGRAVGQGPWKFAGEQGYVSEALDPAYEGAEDQLFHFLDALLAVVDGGLHSASARAASSRSPVSPPRDYAARIEAISRVAAHQAAEDDEILRFRERVLRRTSPMTADEAEAYLDLPEARTPGSGSLPPGGPTELMQYQNRRLSHDIHVWPRSPLDELRGLAASLARSYPWQPAQAAAFVLEGLAPLATPFVLRFPQTWHEGRPRRAKVTMEVDLWIPASAVTRAYRKLQRRVLPGYNRPISRRSIDVVNFVLRHRPATWPALLARWNSEHPGDAYADYRNFRWAFERAKRSLLQPNYRLYLPPED